MFCIISSLLITTIKPKCSTENKLVWLCWKLKIKVLANKILELKSNLLESYKINKYRY